MLKENLKKTAATVSIFTFTAIAATTGGTVAPAMAQQLALEEIVVTARQRAESIQDIPISITAFSAADMDKRGILSMSDIALNTPGFNFENFGNSGATAPVIRGATQVAGSIEQNVSFFYDGIYLPRNYVTDLGFANIGRIEVVKGPQSARYGRNAFTGAVNYISKKPTEEWTAEGQLTAGSFGRFDGSAAVSGAIVPETLRVRASVDYSEFDGSWKNSHPFAAIDFDEGTNERLGGWEDTTYSGAIEFLPNEDIQIEAMYLHVDKKREHSAQNWFGELNADSQLMNCGQYNPDVRPAGSGLGGGGDWFRLFCGELEPRAIPIDPRGYAQRLDTDFIRASIDWDITDDWTFEYQFGQIKANTKTFGYKDTLPGCTFFVPLCVFESGPIGNFKTDSHEARVVFNDDSNIDGAFGVYYAKSTDFRTSNFGALLPLSAVPTAPVDVLDASQFVFQVALSNITTVTETTSVFGELNIAFMEDRARLGIEARYSEDKKEEGEAASGGGTGGLGAFAGAFFSDTFSSFTPRVTFEYDVNDDSLLFASAAKGVKSGGFSAAATLPENRTYDDDQNWTYEIGSKNTFNDGQVQLNATLFYIDWTNVQILAADEGNVNPLSRSIVRNVGDVTSKGIEVDGAIAANENLSFYGTLYYGDAKYKDGTIDGRWGRDPAVCDDVVCNINGDIGGNQMERQSKFQTTLGGEWSDELSADMGLDYFIRADLAHQSKMFGEAVNLSIVPARTIFNASLGIEGDGYSIQLWGKNLTDKKYVSNAVVQQPNVAYNAYLGERATFGITLTARY
ncbi:MAG: TonB-dependent receptor [Rhodospirillaceae bacterium]|nr:TonB-dependent receptor [Rhodospirillaceae bacterium]